MLVLSAAPMKAEVVTMFRFSSVTSTLVCKKIKKGANASVKMTMIIGNNNSLMDATGWIELNAKTTRIIGITSAIATPMKNFVCNALRSSGVCFTLSMNNLNTTKIEITAIIEANINK